MYTVAADEIFFNFIYNYYHNMGLLKKQEICFYQIEYSLLNAKYGFKFENVKKAAYSVLVRRILSLTREPFNVTQTLRIF